MKIFIIVIHIIIGIALIGLILLQNGKGGLGGGLGSGETYRSKRGAERIVFTGTIVITVIFLITSILNLLVH
jgi:preprotein translocase subunit SecG